MGIAFYSVKCFLNHVLIFSTRIFPYCRKSQHCEYHTTSTSSMNVAIILWRCFHNVLRKHCSNTLETFLKYVAATSFANVFTTFPQRCDNVFATFEYDVKATSGGNIFTTVAQHLSNVPGLRCSNVSRQHFHNSTLWQRSRNFPGDLDAM